MAVILKGTTFDDHVHEVTMPVKAFEAQRIDIIAWLIDNFGYNEDSGHWGMWEWAGHTVYFSFRYEDHAMAFKLAWT